MTKLAGIVHVLLLLFALLVSSAFTSSLSKCPQDCHCDLDPSGRYYTECNRPKTMDEFEPRDFDEKMEVIIVRDPANTLTIGPVFSRFKKLETLRITGANVPAIGLRSFWGILSLRTLDLSQNNLTLINAENFYGLQNLVELNLAGNKIGRVPSGTFSYLRELRILNLADNSLKKMLSSLFQGLSKLRYLDLSANPLGDLAADVFRDIADLRALKCRKCHLSNIDRHLYIFLQHLVELDLGENQLQYLDRDEFKDLKSLKRIHLDGNQLSAVVDDLFHRQKSLEYIDLSWNRIRRLSKRAFCNLSNLTTLDISYNKMPAIDLDYTCQLPKLETLNISGNMQLNMANLKSLFLNMSQLRALAMADFANIPWDMFAMLNNLERLNISGARLGNETGLLLEPLRTLKELDLSRNDLKGFDEELAEKLLNIENVRFEENQIICDVCNVGAMLDRKHLMKWKYMPECYVPEILRGKPINRLVKNNLVECYENYLEVGYDAASISHRILHESQLNVIAFMGASIFVLLLLIIIVSISICTRQRAHYYTREDGKGAAESASEKCLKEGSLITGTEINFKFPLDEDRICTVDEICLPPPPPPPPNKSTNGMRSS